MLEISALSRSYGTFKAVDRVSFSIDQSEIVGLLGHNGAGKTTIMKMLSGALEPDSGTISFRGLDPIANPKAIQHELGYLPENLPVYPEMLVADYLDYAAALKGIDQAMIQAEVIRVVHETDIAAKFLDPISTLSRGFKQRVGVAQAILGKPSLLILDEPTNGLDPTQTEQMRQLIQGLARSATVILSTHIMQEVDAICDRVLILRQGELVIDSKLDDLRSAHRLILCTSLTLDEAQNDLTKVEGVVSVELSPDKAEEIGLQTYHIKLADTAGTYQVSAQIADAVHKANGKLYGLRPERKSLESLFHDVNHPPISSPEEHHHVA